MSPSQVKLDLLAWRPFRFWSMAHESRTDLAMLLGALFLLVVGAGPWSLDARITGRR